GNILLYVTIAVVAMDFVGDIAYVNRPMFLEYHVGPQGYVVFTAMGLVGGIIGSYFAGKIGSKFRLGKFAFALLMLAGTVRVAFALVVPVSYAGGLVTIVTYLAIVTLLGTIFTSLNQKIPPEDMVGRVDTISTTFVAIAVALGALAGGFLGRAVPDVGYIFILQGASYAFIGAFLMLVPSFRKLPVMSEVRRQ
ncbi:MAG: hypothetical protein FWC32_00935, partial [Firmicutes bacterium]|nr:hypothetical protein [Bacillota bacterium]